MRSENEIREKIGKYMDSLWALQHDPCVDAGEVGKAYGVIDALLWVIGDESGAPI